MKATVAKMFARLPGPPEAMWPEGAPLVTAFAHGTMSVEFYAPRGTDRQVSHTRDELYFIVQGRGEFVHEGRRVSFGPGDAFFVAAREKHRFENFSNDFATWVVFWGPEGGEKP